MVKARISCDFRRAPSQRGFTYVWVLLCVALMGAGLVAGSEVWVTSARTQRLQELEWIGMQFTQAIGSYYESTPGSVKRYPRTLEDLLEDRRFMTTRRHLRMVYRNPFTHKGDWELIRSADSEVRGVRMSVPIEEGHRVREFIYLPLSGSR